MLGDEVRPRENGSVTTIQPRAAPAPQTSRSPELGSIAFSCTDHSTLAAQPLSAQPLSASPLAALCVTSLSIRFVLKFRQGEDPSRSVTPCHSEVAPGQPLTLDFLTGRSSFSSWDPGVRQWWPGSHDQSLALYFGENYDCFPQDQVVCWARIRG